MKASTARSKAVTLVATGGFLSDSRLPVRASLDASASLRLSDVTSTWSHNGNTRAVR